MKGLIILLLLFSCNSVEKTKKVDELYGKVKSTKTYSYLANEENGKISSKMLVQYYVSNYNEKGQIIQKIHYSPEGVITGSWKYVYDENGNNIIVEGYSAFNDKPELKLQYNYDKNGYQTERLSISIENGTITGRWKFKNDANGNPTETLRWNANQVLQDKRIVKYDEHGNITEEQLFFYPEEEKAIFHAKYTYELDAQNNWIVMKDYRPNHGGELSELLVREILYDEP
ncbi:MAG TPA: hypothetical protein VL021_00335 [Brumimicrobium sp.]|nr:hypothetical protein [Brumimicrobium sp.]